MPQAVTIENVGQAFAMLKEMQTEGLVRGEDHRSLGRTALARLIEEQMAAAIERHLEQMAELDQADRRNGSYSRHLLTALGDIELCVPRTRHFSAGAVLPAYLDRETRLLNLCKQTASSHSSPPTSVSGSARDQASQSKH